MGDASSFGQRRLFGQPHMRKALAQARRHAFGVFRSGTSQALRHRRATDVFRAELAYFLWPVAPRD